MISSVIMLVLCFVVMGVYLALGRVVAAHVGCGSMVTPFRAMFTGLGLWYLWVLVMHVFIGVNLDLTWFTFFVSAVVLAIVLTKAHKIETKKIKLFWMQVLLAIGLLLPVMLIATADVPTQLYEFLDVLGNGHAIAELKNLPSAEDVHTMGMFAPEQPKLLQLMVAPFSLMYGKLPDATFTLMNLLILASLTGAVSRAVEVELTGKNIVMASVLAIVGLTLFNPFFSDELILSANRDLLTAALLFAALSPVMMTSSLPKWVSVLPTAFIMAALVGAHGNGIYLFGLVFVVWAIRTVAEYKADPKSLIGLLALFIIPLAAVFAWDIYTLETYGGAAYTAYAFNIGNISSAVSAFANVILSFAPGIVLIVAIFYGAVKCFAEDVRGVTSFSLFIKERSYLWVPMIAVLYYFGYLSIVAATSNPEVAEPLTKSHLIHLQFVLLVPLWRYIVHFYTDKLDLKGWLDSVPMRASLVAVAVFVGLVVINQGNFKDKQAASIEHSLAVAEEIREGHKDANKIAVLDKERLAPLYATLLGYGLKNEAMASPVANAFYNETTKIADFHESLVASGYDYLWIHVPDEDVRKRLNLQLKPDYSYLFKVTPSFLKFVAEFPHLAYRESRLK